MLRKVLAPLFGYYPWRCSACLSVFMIKSRGKKKSAREEDVSREQLTSQS
jgi:hypothetical protein